MLRFKYNTNSDGIEIKERTNADEIDWVESVGNALIELMAAIDDWSALCDE